MNRSLVYTALGMTLLLAVGLLILVLAGRDGRSASAVVSTGESVGGTASADRPPFSIIESEELPDGTTRITVHDQWIDPTESVLGHEDAPADDAAIGYRLEGAAADYPTTASATTLATAAPDEGRVDSPKDPEQPTSTPPTEEGLINITGRVILHPSGDPAPDATLEIRRLSPEHQVLVRQMLQVDPGTGRFEFTLSQSEGLSISAVSRSHSINVFHPPGTLRDGQEIVITLHERAILRGRLVYANDGEGVSPASVSVYGAGGFDSRQTTRTLLDGSFTLPYLGAGIFTVEASHDDSPGFVHSEQVQISGNPDEVVIVRFPGGDYLEGIVTDPDGQPIAGAIVVWHLYQPQSTQTDEEGRFRISRLYSETRIQQLTVSAEGYTPESRRSIQLKDGVQRFVLQPRSGIVLAVNWDDGTPVTDYGYRLLREGWNRTDLDPGIHQIRVADEEGRTPLDGIDPGRWKVEVTVFDGEGNATELRDAVEFELASGEKERVVEVRISGGRTISGIVTLNEGGPPLEGVRVQFLAPEFVGGSTGRPSESLNIPDVYTAADGTFQASGIPPGQQILVLRRDDLVTDGPVTVDVPMANDPDFLHIVMRQGASIFGSVIALDGRPIAGARINQSTQAASGTKYERGQVVTNAEGRYALTGLWPGVHFVGVSSRDGLNRFITVTLEPGEQRELNFDFREGTILSGVIRLNGRPARPNDVFLMLSSGEENSPWFGPIDSRGRYEVHAKPGRHGLRFLINGETIFSPNLYTVANGETAQIDFDLEVVSADVVVTFPDGSRFSPGRVVIAPPESPSSYTFMRRDMAQENRHLPAISAGPYIATFDSRDGQWSGDSGIVQLGSGRANRFHIEARPSSRGEVVHTWRPGELETSWRQLRFNVSHLIPAPGTLTATIRYQRGRHAVATREAVLFRSGQPASADRHQGWSGFDQVGNSYRLRVDPYQEDRVWELMVDMRSDGGNDSYGTIFVAFDPDGG
jgi:hypothetical protein